MLSPWETVHFHKRPHLAVVGGGIVGLFTALFHKRAHPAHHVVVLERGAFPSGASVKNAGFACFGSPSELLADMEKEGRAAALARVEERWRGLLELRQELGDAHIGFEPTGGHEVYRAHDPLYTRVAEGFDALNELLLPLFSEPVYRWNDAGIGQVGPAGAVHMASTHLEGPLDSGALMSTLLRKAQSEGVIFRASSTVTALDDVPDGVMIHLTDGTRLTAGRVVVATNGYTPTLLPQLDVVPARGQVVRTAPIPGLRLKGTFHADEGFYYFRDYAGGVLLGGARNADFAGETTLADGTTPVVQAALERFLTEVVLPGTPFTIVQRWSGIMGFGRDSKTPIVQRLSERIAVAVRLGGMGVAIGIRVARRAAELVRE